MNYKDYYDSPLGKIILVSDGDNLTVLKLECHRFYDPLMFQEIEERGDLEIFIKTKNWLDRYFRGENPHLSEIPMSPSGSSFRRMVWKILCHIPYGEVITYGDVAKEIERRTGKKMSSQAVGGAVGHNPISIIIPCHRVVGANGSLTGYGGGIENKIKLLELEGVDMTKLSISNKKSN